LHGTRLFIYIYTEPQIAQEQYPCSQVDKMFGSAAILEMRLAATRQMLQSFTCCTGMNGSIWPPAAMPQHIRPPCHRSVAHACSASARYMASDGFSLHRRRSDSCRYGDVDSDAESVPTPVYPASPEAAHADGSAARGAPVAVGTFEASPTLPDVAHHSHRAKAEDFSDPDVAGPLPTFFSRSRHAISSAPALHCPAHADATQLKLHVRVSLHGNAAHGKQPLFRRDITHIMCFH